jgi:hypothetical protein
MSPWNGRCEFYSTMKDSIKVGLSPEVNWC